MHVYWNFGLSFQLINSEFADATLSETSRFDVWYFNLDWLLNIFFLL